MGQPRAQMIAGAVQENLRLIFEPAKCTRVNDPGAITLELGPVAVALLGIFSAARVPRFLGERCERGALDRFHLVARSPTVFHLAINPLMSILSVAREPLPIFRVMPALLAALPIAATAARARAKTASLSGGCSDRESLRGSRARQTTLPPTVFRRAIFPSSKLR